MVGKGVQGFLQQRANAAPDPNSTLKHPRPALRFGEENVLKTTAPASTRDSRTRHTFAESGGAAGREAEATHGKGWKSQPPQGQALGVWLDNLTVLSDRRGVAFRDPSPPQILSRKQPHTPKVEKETQM